MKHNSESSLNPLSVKFGYRYRIVDSEKLELLAGIDINYSDENLSIFGLERRRYLYGTFLLEMNYKLNDRMKIYSGIEFPSNGFGPSANLGFQYQLGKRKKRKKKWLD